MNRERSTVWLLESFIPLLQCILLIGSSVRLCDSAECRAFLRSHPCVTGTGTVPVKACTGTAATAVRCTTKSSKNNSFPPTEIQQGDPKMLHAAIWSRRSPEPTTILSPPSQKPSPPSPEPRRWTSTGTREADSIAHQTQLPLQRKGHKLRLPSRQQQPTHLLMRWHCPPTPPCSSLPGAAPSRLLLALETLWQGKAGLQCRTKSQIVESNLDGCGGSSTWRRGAVRAVCHQTCCWKHGEFLEQEQGTGMQVSSSGGRRCESSRHRGLGACRLLQFPTASPLALLAAPTMFVFAGDRGRWGVMGGGGWKEGHDSRHESSRGASSPWPGRGA